ncbi:uncharacterized protein LOC110459732 isoform X2 [Mizuhopecten yessoensis]|uniref:uncharacterized protein LOC110459732 isoform X2 n=1 Tax=Mizuhopecten yessoensis TaxID=6573 RepID=UPI000B45A151|nr:uncharacterized protein LOC110459732 isoform X2 [Mizuhopecten yessoensis]
MASIYRRRNSTGFCLLSARLAVVDKGSFSKRTMDSASPNALDFPDDAIDKVARANSVRLDSNGILPEVRASPCPMHSKYDKKSDLMYMSSHNGGSPHHHVKKNGKVRKMVSSSSHENALSANRDTNEDLAVVGRMPSKNSLPGNMPSKEFVMTWLMYGSEPGSGNHFPELVKNESDKKSRGKTVIRKGTTKDLSFGE